MVKLIFYEGRPSTSLLGRDLVARLREHAIGAPQDGLSSAALLFVRDDEICWPVSLYLQAVAEGSPSDSLETVRTYGECLVDWLHYLLSRGVQLNEASDRHLIAYRNTMFRRKEKAADTVNLRTFSVVRFYRWTARILGWDSSIADIAWKGSFHFGRDQLIRSPRALVNEMRLAVPRDERLPRAVPRQQLQELFSHLDATNQLCARWMASTGIRRAEVCNLDGRDVPEVSSWDPVENRIVMLRIRRKGMPRAKLFAPFALIETTNWFVLTEHGGRLSNHAPLFRGAMGDRLNPDVLGMRIRDAGRLIGIQVTPHALRHTFALVVLKLLQDAVARGAELNPLKVLQVLLGHASLETTNIYLRAIEIQSEAVAEVLDYLYGSSPSVTSDVAQWLKTF